MKPSNLNNKTVDEIYGEYTTYMDIAQPNVVKTGIEKFVRRLIEWCNNNKIEIQIVENVIKCKEINND